MIVTAWNNGSHHPSGAGYGLEVTVADRDQYFKRDWKTIFVQLEGQSQPVEINVAKPSFWTHTCHELISAEVGRWLKQKGLVPWPKGQPPKLVLEVMDGPRQFLLKTK